MNEHRRIENRERVARRRAALRAQGLRPKQFWIPDTRRPGFWEEARRQAAAIGTSDADRDEQAWVDSVSIWNDHAFWHQE